MSKGGDRLVRDVIDALAASVDANELRQRLSGHFAQRTSEPRTSPAAVGGGELSQAAQKLQSRIGLADILDDAILNARPGDHAFPLRLLFGQLVSDCSDDDLSFALASGLNLYFRATMPEESKVRVALEVSRLYYQYAERSLEAELPRQVSPLLARLMSTELSQLRLESVDHVRVFDSAMHERADDADKTSSTVRGARSFLCRVASSERPRFKAVVVT